MSEIILTIFRIIFIGGLAVVGLVVIAMGIWLKLKEKEEGKYGDRAFSFFSTWMIVAGSIWVGLLSRELFNIPGLIIEAAFIGFVVAVILFVIGAKMYSKWPRTSKILRTISAISITVSLVFGL